MKREHLSLNYEMAECTKKRAHFGQAREIPVVLTTKAAFENNKESLIDVEKRTLRSLFRIVQQSEKEPLGKFRIFLQPVI